MTERPEERIARNNGLFRDANEKIRERAAEYDAPLDRLPFLCECPQEDCMEIIRLTMEEYRTIRSDQTHFFTTAGHEIAEQPLATVVARYDGYVVVQKGRVGQ